MIVGLVLAESTTEIFKIILIKQGTSCLFTIAIIKELDFCLDAEEVVHASYEVLPRVEECNYSM